MMPEPKTPYRQGYESSMIGDGGKTQPNRYERGTPEYDQWEEGFGDATEDYIHYNEMIDYRGNEYG